MNILAIVFAFFVLASTLYAVKQWGLLAGLIVGLPLVGALRVIINIGGQ